MYIPSYFARMVLKDEVRLFKLTPMEPVLTGGYLQAPVDVHDVRGRETAEATVFFSESRTVRDLVSNPAVQNAMKNAYQQATGKDAPRSFEIEWDETVSIKVPGEAGEAPSGERRRRHARPAPASAREGS
jgi:hypothetical protein